MAESRQCARCGTTFEPKREHARFCSARCRVAWNRENWNRENRRQPRWGTENWAQGNAAGQGSPESALGWAIIAMRDVTERLGRVRASDHPQAFAVIGEAVWWVTIVDATLVRYHPEAYEQTLAGMQGPRRRLTEGTFAGLRFVRNRMGYKADPDDFIHPLPGGSGPPGGLIAAWTWKSVSEPSLSSLPQRGQDWEMTRYRAYQAQLAGHPIGDTFSRAAAFLRRASDASLSHA
jgi:endogenous inhibitor of DNA gyrase (YacG/DUF329 family)